MLECFDGLIDERKSRQENGFLIVCLGWLYGLMWYNSPSLVFLFCHLSTYACQSGSATDVLWRERKRKTDVSDPHNP